MSNILKKELDCTCEDFLAKVYGNRSKPFTNAVKSLFVSVLTRNSTLVKDLSALLRHSRKKDECKRTQEMVSRWLSNYSFSGALGSYLLDSFSGYVTEQTTVAIDFSDISKEFGGAGMEGMEMGWDGSRGCVAMGHDFISVSIVGAEHKDAVPLYMKLGKGRHCKEELLYDAIDCVMEKTDGKGWMVVDRGLDDAEFIHRMKRDRRNVVVRIKEMGRDVFGNGRRIDETLERFVFEKTVLNTYRGARSAQVRFAVGIMQHCVTPKVKDAPVYESKVLVVESRFNGNSIYMYVVCPDEVADDPGLMRAYAIKAAQAYCDRWQIETSFQTVKQEFRLEDARVRTFKRLENIFALCVMAYVFMTKYLRGSKRFKKIVKLLGDNVETLAFKIHSLLSAIRELYLEAKVRFITGRPRKAEKSDSAQMFFVLE